MPDLDRDESRRLEEIPGIGPIVATALVAEAGECKAFSSARNLAAWIGLFLSSIRPAARNALVGQAGKSMFALAARRRRYDGHLISTVLDLDTPVILLLTFCITA